MPSSLELKFLIEDPEALKRVVAGHGMSERRMRQDDRYFYSRRRYAKLRTTDCGAPSLITYDRRIMPGSKVSEYDKIDVEDAPQLLAALGFLAPIALVSKVRHQFTSSGITLNFDDVEGVGSIVEIEIDDSGDQERDRSIMAQWLDKFGLSASRACPYSNAHLVNILARARSLPSLHEASRRNVCFLDGSSASGKSTVKSSILRTYPKTVMYVARETTRKPRADDSEHGDYRFVSDDQFFMSALSGDYVECRDYLFGMSYGLPWLDLASITSEGQVALALVNLGSGHFLKRLIPNSLTILLYADPEVVRFRLESRQGLRPDQIEERVENSRQAFDYSQDYDLALNTGEMSVTEVIRRIADELGGGFY